MKVLKESFTESTDEYPNLNLSNEFKSWLDTAPKWVKDKVKFANDSGFDIDEEEFMQAVDNKEITEDTVKTKDGKWTNKGKEGTHGKFDTKKQADAQRKAMFANGFKEEISDEDMKHQKENEDTINLMEEILVSIDNAVHTLKNRVYYGGSFEPNITNLEQSCNKMIKFSKELKEY